MIISCLGVGSISPIKAPRALEISDKVAPSLEAQAGTVPAGQPVLTFIGSSPSQQGRCKMREPFPRPLAAGPIPSDCHTYGHKVTALSTNHPIPQLAFISYSTQDERCHHPLKVPDGRPIRISVKLTLQLVRKVAIEQDSRAYGTRVLKRGQRPLSIGLLALLDDVAAIAKVASASLDDVVSQAAKAGAKAAAVVVDDAAVTPRYVVGFVADRELPIVGKIAVGSLRNKLLILLPCTLALSYFLPWMITPLLMFGGAYLCYEGTEKVLEAIVPHRAHAYEAMLDTAALNPHTLEEEKVAGAIKTDFILSAEIMAITLAAVPETGILMQALVLALVGIGITVAVYGVVALIVKADDVGVALAGNDGGSMIDGLCRAIGRALVVGMPGFLTLLGAVGTAAMIWVGGAIIVHGLEVYGTVGQTIDSAAKATAQVLPFAAGVVKWTVVSFLSGMVGLLIGAVSMPLVGFAFAPAWKLFKAFYARAKG